MASDILVGISIGAVLKASVGAVMKSSGGLIKGLERATQGLTVRQKELGRTMQREAARGKQSLDNQRKYYDRVGNAIDRVKSAQIGLAAATKRTNELTEKSRHLFGKLTTTAFAAYGTAKSVMGTAGMAANFQDTLRDIRIDSHLSAEQELQLGQAIGAASVSSNQDRDSLALAAKGMLSGGASVAETNAKLAMMGDLMTGLRLSADTSVGAINALRDMGAVDAASSQAALERLIAIGQKGSFSPAMMVEAFAELGDTIKQAGIKGDEAIGELAAGLQIAEASMGADAAKSGLQSWIMSMSDKKIAQAYESAGVDYVASLAKMQAQGLSQYEASLEIAGGFLRDKLSEQDQQALLKGDDDGRMLETLQQLGLGEVFKDMNAARFALSVNNNKQQYKEMAGTDGTGSLEALAQLRKESPAEQFKSLKLGVSELGLSIGTALLPPLLDLVEWLKPVVSGIVAFAQANPNLIRTIAGVVVGFVGMKVAFGMVGLAVYGLRVPFAFLQTTMATARGGLALLNVGWLAGASIGSKLVGVLGRLGAGLKLAGQAVLWLGRAMMANPIGLAVAAIAGAAFLIYKYWQPIKGFFSNLWGGIQNIFSTAVNAISGFMGRLWASIKETAARIYNWATGIFSGMWDSIKQAFSGGIGGVAQLLLNWSPLGIIYKIIRAGLSALGVELPEKFSDFGAMLLQGLISGISNMAGAVKDAISNLGGSVMGWFKDKLGIASPSRVFMELGGFVAEGAALGIENLTPRATEAAGLLASEVAQAGRLSGLDTSGLGAIEGVAAGATLLQKSAPEVASIAPPSLSQREEQREGQNPASINMTFAPVINVTASGQAGAGLGDQVQSAVRASFEQFKQHMHRYLHEQQRVSYSNVAL